MAFPFPLAIAPSISEILLARDLYCSNETACPSKIRLKAISGWTPSDSSIWCCAISAVKTAIFVYKKSTISY